MPDPTSDGTPDGAPHFERRLRQRSALAEFALRALGSGDAVEAMEAATTAAADGLGLEHAAVFERKRYGFELLACAGWPRAAQGQPPATAAQAFDRSEAVETRGEGEMAHGLALRVDGDTPRLLAVAAPRPLALDDDDRAFLRDLAAVLTGALRRAGDERALIASEARARTSEARAHAVLDATVDGILTIDERGRVLSVNPAAERIFGYRAAELLGENVSVLMPEPTRAHHDGYLDAYLTTGRRRIIGIGREVIGRRRDGSTFPMELAVSEVVVPGVRMFTGIVRDISERRHLEREVVLGIEAERHQIARDLHDELGQELSGIRLLTRDLARRLRDAEAPEADELDEIATLVRDADQKARSISRGLLSVRIESEGLGEALRQMTTRAARLFDLPISFDASGTPVALDATTATHVFRIAQEAVTNAARHARPTTLRVAVDWGTDQLSLTVADDGVGLPTDPTAARAARPGLGIQTMRYRARLLGGHLDLSPGDAGGTVITATFPTTYAAPADLDLGDAPA